MNLRTRGRYHYGPVSGRPQYEWLGGDRLAFYVAVSAEHIHFGEGLGHRPSFAAPKPGVRSFAWRDCGLRVGVSRLFNLFDELQVPAWALTRPCS